MIGKISVIGLGKLGMPMAACFAAKGIRVVGVDVDAAKLEAVRQGRSPIFEPGLPGLLAASDGRLQATEEIEQAVLATDVTFITVATPSEPAGGFSLRYVLPVCARIGGALASKNCYHLVVLTSTVMPGSTAGPVKDSLERASGKLTGKDFGLCYSPEFIALGSVIRDFQNPDFLLIGESDARSGECLKAVYQRVCDNNPPAARMSLLNAEITKLAVNTFVTMKISFANMLARICEALEGADVDAVTAALGLDRRIGPKYLKGAISYGGPCFPRDNLALAVLARQLGVPGDIAQTTDRFNRSQIVWLADLVERLLPRGGRAGVLGLTYKPGTDVVEESAGMHLAAELARREVPVTVFDPSGRPMLPAAAGNTVEFAATALECVASSDVIVVATPWPEFREIAREHWERSPASRTVIDCWRVLPALVEADRVNYVPLGTGGKLSAAGERRSAAAGGAAESVGLGSGGS